MVAQPDGFEIGEEELVEAILEPDALIAVAEAADDELDEDDEDIEDGDELMNDDEEIAANLHEKMTFGPDDGISPYDSD